MRNRLNFGLWICLACNVLFINGCQRLEQSSIVIQADMAKNPIYKKLDKEEDNWEFGTDTLPKPKTSNVKYVNDRNHSLKDTTYARSYNCKSSLKDGVLKIRIGSNSGFVGEGFWIDCEGQRFSIKPYYSTDAIPINPPKPTFKAIEQNLILNKPQYMVGDSIWGKVKFKIIEQNGDQTITHIADGYFRSKVTKDEY